MCMGHSPVAEKRELIGPFITPLVLLGIKLSSSLLQVFQHSSAGPFSSLRCAPIALRSCSDPLLSLQMAFRIGLAIILLSVVGCDEKVVADDGSPQKCYECNSAYDPRCEDPFDGEKSKSLLVTCAPHPSRDEYGKIVDTKAIGCRKGLQNVGDQSRIIRQCSYSGELKDPKEENKATKRVGSGKNDNAVRMWYWHCAKEGCNGATAVAPMSILSAIGLQVLLVFLAK